MNGLIVTFILLLSNERGEGEKTQKIIVIIIMREREIIVATQKCILLIFTNLMMLLEKSQMACYQ